MKGKIAVLLILLLVLSLFSACGKAEAPVPTQTPAQVPAETIAPTTAPEPTSEPTPEPEQNGSLADGTYTVELTFAGGTGKARIESPAQLIVSGGTITAVLRWSSKNYDYMRIGETKYYPINAAGENSVFEVPLSVFDQPITVYGDTVAMSEPHEIEYTLTFDSSSIQAVN